MARLFTLIYGEERKGGRREKTGVRVGTKLCIIATINNVCFSNLNKDLVKLRLHRELIANGPVLNGSKANLDVVDGLIKCFDQSYAVAYSTCQ